MAVITSSALLLACLVIPATFAASIHSRTSTDIAEMQAVLRKESSEQILIRTGRKLSEQDFSTDLSALPPTPVLNGHQSGYQSLPKNKVRVIPVINSSVGAVKSPRPYGAVPVKSPRRTASRPSSLSMAQSYPDLTNDLDLGSGQRSSTTVRSNQKKQNISIKGSLYVDNNGLLRR